MGGGLKEGKKVGRTSGSGRGRVFGVGQREGTVVVGC